MKNLDAQNMGSTSLREGWTPDRRFVQYSYEMTPSVPPATELSAEASEALKKFAAAIEKKILQDD